MKYLKNEKGFTLVEILVVIAIIAILFVTLLPQIDRAVDRARQTGVKTDFRSYQLAAEAYLRETNGKEFSKAGFESHLEVGLHLVPDANNTNPVNKGMDSKEKDAWGTPYDVFIIPNNKMIAIVSFGPNENFDVLTSPTSDDFILATYVVDGTVASCTVGFESNDLMPTLLKEATSGIATWSCGQPLSGGVAQALIN